MNSCHDMKIAPQMVENARFEGFIFGRMSHPFKELTPNRCMKKPTFC